MSEGQHAWVKHTVTLVSVISDPQSDEGFFAIDDTEVEPWSVYGCNVCSVPLNADTVNTPCEKAIQHGGNFSAG